MAEPVELKITRGKTLSQLIAWENADQIVRKPITGISLAAGAPRITAVGHGAPNRWRCAAVMVKGMKQINAVGEPMCGDNYHRATVIDADTVEFNDITPVDAAGKEWPAYESGGFLIYYAPLDLANKVVDVVIKDKVGGTVLLSSRAGDAPLNKITATVDNAAKTILIRIGAADTAAIAWNKAVWEAEIRDTVTGDVFPLIPVSPVLVGNEVAS